MRNKIIVQLFGEDCLKRPWYYIWLFLIGGTAYLTRFSLLFLILTFAIWFPLAFIADER